MIQRASFDDYYRPPGNNPFTDALGMGIKLYGLQKSFDLQGKENALKEREIAGQEAMLPLKQQDVGIAQQNADTNKMNAETDYQSKVLPHLQNFSPAKTAVLRAQFKNMGIDKYLSPVLDSMDALGKDAKIRNIDAYETIKANWSSWYQPKVVEGLQKAITDGVENDPNFMNTTTGKAAQKMLDGVSVDSAGQMVDGLFSESLRSMEAEDIKLLALIKPPTAAAPSELGKMIAERNQTLEGSPERAFYDKGLAKEVAQRGGLKFTQNADGSIVFEEGMPGVGTGGVGPAKLSKAVETKVQEGAIEMNSLLSDVKAIRQGFDPSVFQIQDKAGAAWATLKDKLGAATPQEKATIEKFVNAKADAARLFAERMKVMSGVVVTPQEAKRQEAYLPTPGNGVFDGDSPKEFDSKLTKMEQFIKRAVARYNYVRNNGLTKIDAVPLEKMDTVISQRGQALAKGGMDKQTVLKTLAEEFGLMF